MGTVEKRPLNEMKIKILAYLDDWAVFFGVHHQWTLHVYFKTPKEGISDKSRAETTWPSNYTTASITFNTDQLKKENPCDCILEQTAVHELGHLISYEMWDFIDANYKGAAADLLYGIEEKTVDKWMRIVIRARYGDENRCDRHLELYDGDIPSGSDPVESVRSEEGDSGWLVRDDSPSADGISDIEWLRRGGLRVDHGPVFSAGDS